MTASEFLAQLAEKFESGLIPPADYRPLALLCRDYAIIAGPRDIIPLAATTPVSAKRKRRRA